MRSALVVAHTRRNHISEMAGAAAQQLLSAGFEVRMLPPDAAGCALPTAVRVLEDNAADGVEVVLAFGGDGTFLRAAEIARPAGVPLLGVNFGHVGFLAEAEPEALASTVAMIVARTYEVEERLTVDAEVWQDGQLLAETWALNEASLERSNRERMLEVAVAVDERPLLRFGCDGVLCATPTGSTAYAFSVGGPILWPNVEALIVVPNAAHALFARPMVVAADSIIDIDLIGGEHHAVLSCDGRRSVAVPPGARVRVRRGRAPIRLARVSEGSFGERLVAKFQLPVHGFRDLGVERTRLGDTSHGPTPRE
jgi:NAD+ kinase